MGQYDRFYPRHPRGWRLRQAAKALDGLCVSIHATLAGGDGQAPWMHFASDLVSIHATLAGGDAARASTLKTSTHVSIHATLAGGDPHAKLTGALDYSFLSTPPSRVATKGPHQRHKRRLCFYPRHPRGWRRRFQHFRIARRLRFYPRHPRGWRLRRLESPCYGICFYPRHPRGWRQRYMGLQKYFEYVSIHATLAGGDPDKAARLRARGKFLSTPPSRVATRSPANRYRQNQVSIHATLAGGDLVQHYRILHCTGVSIHATLAGGDGRSPAKEIGNSAFLSTPPSRVATGTPPVGPYQLRVSIHATLAGGDLLLMAGKSAIDVSIHATLAGGDQRNFYAAGIHDVSIHATLAGGDKCVIFSAFAAPPVSIHATLAGGDRRKKLE